MNDIIHAVLNPELIILELIIIHWEWELVRYLIPLLILINDLKIILELIYQLDVHHQLLHYQVVIILHCTIVLIVTRVLVDLLGIYLSITPLVGEIVIDMITLLP
jgi:hypothetical protein